MNSFLGNINSFQGNINSFQGNINRFQGYIIFLGKKYLTKFLYQTTQVICHPPFLRLQLWACTRKLNHLTKPILKRRGRNVSFFETLLAYCQYLYILSVSDCLSVCLSPINVKTAEPIWTKFCVGHHVTPGKVYGWSKFQKFASNKI